MIIKNLGGNLAKIQEMRVRASESLFNMRGQLSLLKKIIDGYMEKTSGLSEFCDRCLRTERWDGNVVLMVIDAAFTSIGLNYFKTVVPKVLEFAEKFVYNGRVKSLRDLGIIELEELRTIWRNKRSWFVAKQIAQYLSSIHQNDRMALRTWAANSKLDLWKGDPIGKIRGVGLITYQYLRMMGGVDTIMPDKVVKRVINEIFIKAGLRPINDDVLFIKKVEEVAKLCNYRPIELCWMTWLIQSEGDITRNEKYLDILSKI